jgi:hypothetical protein
MFKKLLKKIKFQKNTKNSYFHIIKISIYALNFEKMEKKSIYSKKNNIFNILFLEINKKKLHEIKNYLKLLELSKEKFLSSEEALNYFNFLQYKKKFNYYLKNNFTENEQSKLPIIGLKILKYILENYEN